MYRFLIGLLINSLFLSFTLAQKPLPEIEASLDELAQDILTHPDFEYQKAQNRKFTQILFQCLKRKDSYDYPFDSLETISVLRAEDNSFRIFTWQIIKKAKQDDYYGDIQHFYFGLIQREYVNEYDEKEYIVIPLIEMAEIPRGVENMILDNNNWLGGLYYPPKYGKGVEKQVLKYYDPKGTEPGEKVKMKKQEYFLLMGYNGMDNTSNLKFVDVMSFDPKDKNRIIFGANVFYFDPIVPKFRALFRYSEYAPFSLNYGYIKKKPWGKKKVIVYDHMASPKSGQSKFKEVWELGPDGSYDALVYSRGTYDWKKNVETVSVMTNQQKKAYAENQEHILRARLAQLKRMAEEVGDEKVIAEIEEVESRKNLDKYAMKFLKRKEKLILKKQNKIQKREAKKLKEAGLDLSGNK